MIIKLERRGGGPNYETDALFRVEVEGDESVYFYATPAEVLEIVDAQMRKLSGHDK